MERIVSEEHRKASACHAGSCVTSFVEIGLDRRMRQPHRGFAEAASTSHKRGRSLHIMDTCGVFSDHQREPIWSTHSGGQTPNNFGESGPFCSTLAGATCPVAILSNTNPLDSQMYDVGVIASDTSPTYCGQISDEYSGEYTTFSADMDMVNDDLLWSEFSSWLELEAADLVASYRINPETHHVPIEIEIESSTGEGLLLSVSKDIPETSFVPPDVSTVSTMSGSVRYRWPKFLWLIRACHRFSHAAAARLRAKVPEANSSNVFKGVMEKKGKYVCEMRVMKKIQLEKKKIIKKVWLGTYQTQAQAARALDVGKYFFNAKETKTFFDPNIESMLSTLGQQLLAQPLEVLVVNVKKLAKHYGNHGTLP